MRRLVKDSAIPFAARLVAHPAKPTRDPWNSSEVPQDWRGFPATFARKRAPILDLANSFDG
jgi:hypothetical protein